MMCCVGVLATSDQFHGLSAFARPRKSTLQNYGLFAFFNRITQRYLLPIYRKKSKNLPVHLIDLSLKVDIKFNQYPIQNSSSKQLIFTTQFVLPKNDLNLVKKSKYLQRG